MSKRVLEDVILGIQSSNKGQIGQMTLVLGNQMLLSRPGGVGQAWETLDRPDVKGEAETQGTPGGGCWAQKSWGEESRPGKVKNLTDQGEKGVQNAFRVSQAWEPTSVIPGLKSPKQEVNEFKASLGYIA